MGTKQEVATYVATLIAELVPMCDNAGLSDLAYLLEVAAAEAERHGEPASTHVLEGVASH